MLVFQCCDRLFILMPFANKLHVHLVFLCCCIVRYLFCIILFYCLEFEGHVKLVSPFLTFVQYSCIVWARHCKQRYHTYWSSRNFCVIYFYYIIIRPSKGQLYQIQHHLLSFLWLLPFLILSAFIKYTAPFHIKLLHWASTDYYGIMARTDWNFSFSMSYEMKFEAAIRGHLVYKAAWSLVINEVLICKKDNREEAQEYDSNAVGVY